MLKGDDLNYGLFNIFMESFESLWLCFFKGAGAAISLYSNLVPSARQEEQLKQFLISREAPMTCFISPTIFIQSYKESPGLSTRACLGRGGIRTLGSRIPAKAALTERVVLLPTPKCTVWPFPLTIQLRLIGTMAEEDRICP